MKRRFTLVKVTQYETADAVYGEWFQLEIRVPSWIGRLYWRYLDWKHKP